MLWPWHRPNHCESLLGLFCDNNRTTMFKYDTWRQYRYWRHTVVSYDGKKVQCMSFIAQSIQCRLMIVTLWCSRYWCGTDTNQSRRSEDEADDQSNSLYRASRNGETRLGYTVRYRCATNGRRCLVFRWLTWVGLIRNLENRTHAAQTTDERPHWILERKIVLKHAPR